MGITNLFKLYIPICDYWMIIDNSINPLRVIAEGLKSNEIEIKEKTIWETIKMQAYE
jgi:predicted ABC-type ATPase